MLEFCGEYPCSLISSSRDSLRERWRNNVRNLHRLVRPGTTEEDEFDLSTLGRAADGCIPRRLD
jgi:hypothetical protein